PSASSSRYLHQPWVLAPLRRIVGELAKYDFNSVACRVRSDVPVTPNPRITMNTDESLRYPTGRFKRPTRVLEESERLQMIDAIARTPASLRAAVRGLSDDQLDTPYRPGGWTVRQVVHHVPDSHMNAFIRMKLGLTEH